VRAVALVALCLLAGCAEIADDGDESRALAADGDVAKVYKSDGQTQCHDNGVDEDVMARELTNAGIDVLCSQKGSDGYAYCMACGCGAGRINVYTIHAQNVPDAQDLGFAPVSDLPDYQDQPC
jgi:hypothetical protein